MSKDTIAPMHPGLYIKENIVPEGMSVTKAAKTLGVGRPALSNFLNGKSSLSLDMATRLEKAFGIKRQKVINMQNEFDHHSKKANENKVLVSSYVPQFLTIKANQIEDWASINEIDARQQLSVLLRNLVHSISSELEEVDFPGYDKSQKPGWDGFIKNNSSTPWVPQGISGWEFGCNKEIQKKANDDYNSRVKKLSAKERKDITFIFVTPRNWVGKDKWIKDKNLKGEWKAVKAYDASDLEQWLEQSLVGQIWLGEELHIDTSGMETLEYYWKNWSEVSNPNISSKIFKDSVNRHLDSFEEWLQRQPDQPFIITADSKEEGLAFIKCLFDNSKFTEDLLTSVVIVKSVESLRKLLASSLKFIPVVEKDETERELSGNYRKFHCIIVKSRNAVNTDHGISLDLIGHKTFEEALLDMGVKKNQIDKYARESGCSPTILRRTLSKVPAIKTPRWADNSNVATSLVPIALVGVWHSGSNDDCEIISLLADCYYPQAEKNLNALLKYDDCPVWSVDGYQGIVSKKDALFAIKNSITKEDLKRFFTVATIVLSESDPALELSEDKRWAAGLDGKSRKHSSALRNSICETLVILSVYGDNLLQQRLDVNIEDRVSRIIHDLLFPLTIEKLLSNNSDLPNYAEAAPDEFLKLLENDLKQDNPSLFELLKPTDSGIFGNCPRSGLLWALECLAWKPDYLPRVSNILAKLSEVKIDDNWANKPESSLKSIFWAPMPQTSASLDQRIKTLEIITKRFPDISWKLCISQLLTGLAVDSYNYRPRWRDYASGAGEEVTVKEDNEFARKALDLALNWTSYNEHTLGNLIENLTEIPEEDHDTIWNLIDDWAKKSGDKEKATLREKIRGTTFTRRARRRSSKKKTQNRALQAYKNLKPKDPVICHGWLYKKQWVEASYDVVHSDEFNFEKEAQEINKQRTKAMEDIWKQKEFPGIISLLSDSETPETIGKYIAKCLKKDNEIIAFINSCLGNRSNDLSKKIDGCIKGILTFLDSKQCKIILESFAKNSDSGEITRLLKLAPFCHDTWNLVAELEENIRTKYWSKVHPYWNRHSALELNELIDRLLEVDRPRAAFSTILDSFKEIETSRLKNLIQAVGTKSSKSIEEHYLPDPYYISDALSSLDGRSGVTEYEMAKLEFLFIRILKHHGKHGIPNLEKQISESPLLFAWVTALTCRREDDKQDPPEWKVSGPDNREAAKTASYHLLENVKRTPGLNSDGTIDVKTLNKWIKEARELFATNGRKIRGDQMIGKLLSKAPELEGIWPCQPVCEALEEIASHDIALGFKNGVINSRGVYWGGEGGAQERELAERYHSYAQPLHFEYPFVGGMLENIAKSYDNDAKREDSGARIEKRLRY